VGVAGAVAVWASACDTVRITGEANKHSGVSKESEYISTADPPCLRTFIHFRAPVFGPQSMSLTSRDQVLIWINLAARINSKLEHRRDRHFRQVGDDGPPSDDKSVVEFGPRKIFSRCFGFKRLG